MEFVSSLHTRHPPLVHCHAFATPSAQPRALQASNCSVLLRLSPRCTNLQRASQGRSRRAVHVHANGVYQPFPFNEQEYYRAHLQLVQATSDSLGARPEGNLVFMKEHETVYQKDKKALVLSVGGDTLAGIANQVQRRDSERPLALDLLWKMLSRGQEISKKDWRLVRVAIVDLRNNVYYGRLFFGEAGSDGDKIVWDCDCRPSDACWLSIKAGCPIFIKQDVFDHHAVSIADLMSSAEDAGAATSAMFSSTSGVLGGEAGTLTQEDDSGTALLTRIRTNDPDPIKRLKREMEVALSEEDYVTAVRIRDHPFMKLHLGIVKAQRDGNHQEAQALEEELSKAIEESEERAGGKN